MTMEEKYSHMMSMFKNAVVSVSHSISKDELKMIGKVETDFKLAVDDTPGSQKYLCAELHFAKHMEYQYGTWTKYRVDTKKEKKEIGGVSATEMLEPSPLTKQKVSARGILFAHFVVHHSFVTLDIIWIRLWICDKGRWQ